MGWALPSAAKRRAVCGDRFVGKPGELPRAVLMGAGWVINLCVAEWVIRTGRVSGAVANHSFGRGIRINAH